MKSTLRVPFLFAWVLLYVCDQQVKAFGTGAGGCACCGPAVGGSHLTTSAVTGSLADFNAAFQVDGIAVDSAVTIKADTEYTLSVVASSGDPIKGCLIRVQNASGATTLTPGNNTKNANVCSSIQDVEGVTHTNPNLKTECSGMLVVDGSQSTMTLQVDITVVYENQAVSRYAHTSFEILAETPATTATSAPTSSPVTAAPASSPATAAPSAATATPTPTTSAPTPITFAPTRAPAMVPSVAPTLAPSRAPGAEDECNRFFARCEDDGDCCSEKCGAFFGLFSGRCGFSLF